MKCQIADVIVEIPAAGGMASRCREYIINTNDSADITILESDYEPQTSPWMDYEMLCYMDSGGLFYRDLLRFNGMMLHASAVVLDGKAYLFSGTCGVGKSTHTRLWQTCFADARVINDDKPALRLIDDRWYAYGTPWCGKDGINLNEKAPVAGICFMKQSNVNRIRRVSAQEAVPLVYGQANRRLRKQEDTLRLLTAVDSLVRKIPIFELENLPVPEAAQLSMETMRQAAAQANL